MGWAHRACGHSRFSSAQLLLRAALLSTTSLVPTALAFGFNATFVSCPGSLGGEREDFIYLLTGSGSSTSVSAISSNPPTGAIKGTFGSGLTGYEGMNWGNPTNLPGLDFVGDSILVQIQSDSGGTVTVDFGTGATALLAFTATFAGSPSYQNVLIPLVNGTVVGTGSNLAAVMDINMYIGLNSPGGTWSVDSVAVSGVPEPSTVWLIGASLVGIATRLFWRGCTS